MPGPINFPLPGARRLAPDFNHHRKVAALVRYEVHATEYNADCAGLGVNATLANLSADGYYLQHYETDGGSAGTARTGFGSPPVSCLGWMALAEQIHPRAARVPA